MKTVSVTMEQASDAQLRTFATETLGLEIHPQLGRERLLAKIKQALGEGKNDILVPAEEETEAPPPGLSPAARRGGTRIDGKVVVNIPETEGPGGTDLVPVSVNGRAMAIKRNTDSAIPFPYYVALLHAQVHRYEMDETGQHLNPIPRVLHSYPFNLLSSKEEVAAAAEYWSSEAVQQRDEQNRARSKKGAAKAA